MFGLLGVDNVFYNNIFVMLIFPRLLSLNTFSIVIAKINY